MSVCIIGDFGWATNNSFQLLDPLLPAQHALRGQLRVLRGIIARDRGKLDVAQTELEAYEKAQESLSAHDPIALTGISRYLAGVYLVRGDLTATRRVLNATLQVLEQKLLRQAVELSACHL